MSDGFGSVFHMFCSILFCALSAGYAAYRTCCPTEIYVRIRNAEHDMSCQRRARGVVEADVFGLHAFLASMHYFVRSHDLHSPSSISASY